MSRHNRQLVRRRNRALKAALASASDLEHYAAVCWRVEETGRFPHWARTSDRVWYARGLRATRYYTEPGQPAVLWKI